MLEAERSRQTARDRVRKKAPDIDRTEDDNADVVSDRRANRCAWRRVARPLLFFLVSSEARLWGSGNDDACLVLCSQDVGGVYGHAFRTFVIPRRAKVDGRRVVGRGRRKG